MQPSPAPTQASPPWPPTQMLPLHTRPVTQSAPTPQVPPAGDRQVPELQILEQHSAPSAHTLPTDLQADWQTPLVQVPPLQVVPLGLAGLEHWPVVLSQVPTLWQSSMAVQTTGLLPVQVPFWQV